MVRKPLIVSSIILGVVCGAYMYAAKRPVNKNAGSIAGLEEKARDLPDSLFESVDKEDLLDDKVYLRLASEGWYPEEIVPIMQTAMADKKAAKKKLGYGEYAKQWLPAYGRTGARDSMMVFIDTTFTEEMRRSVREKVPAAIYDAYYPPEEYVSPKDRIKNNIERTPGFFREPLFEPHCGRINWMTVHPDDPDKLYVVPDGCGIFKTDDCGKHWECITDRIPDRANRSQSPGYGIPVDPNDWNHVYAFMANSSVYETKDGGKSWTRVQGATHKTFKRAECFRDANGKLWFLGCQPNGWDTKLWISEDVCKTWHQVEISSNHWETHPETGKRGIWMQYLVQDPDDKNIIYIPTSRAIIYLDLSKIRKDNLGMLFAYAVGRLSFDVWGTEGIKKGDVRRATGFSRDKGKNANSTNLFPCPATQPGDLQINPNNHDEWWFATGAYFGSDAYTACYYSPDRGKNWQTLQDVAYGIGEGILFGMEIPGGWLGGFGVNFKNTKYLYGCALSTGRSTDGGRTWSNLHWATELSHLDRYGRYTWAPAANHNSDSHFIRSHKTGRVFRGCDVGLLMIQTEEIPESKAYRTTPHTQWQHIAGKMGQTLFYNVAVNEFGDQTIFGNNQDNDGQTYRYGRWGNAIGYEGSDGFLNPYSGACYVAGGGGLQGFDPEYMSVSSWWYGRSWADVVTGSWYVTRTGMPGKTLMRVDDLGQKTVNLEPNVGSGVTWNNKLGLCRDKGVSTMYVLGNNNYLKKSTDGGDTFEYVKTPSGTNAQFSGALLATDPNNSDVIYLGYQGYVNRYNIKTGVIERMGGNTLPNVACSRLFYHEGSGDLYFVHTASAGIYILECTDKKAGTYDPAGWKYWLRGYNSGKFTAAEINYTTQEMVIADYGRSVWCADLQNPSDRYFDDGFELKEYSHKAGRRTIGIDTQWTIPLYYNFKWTVNGENVDCPYQYLQRALNPGDRVQLELTLRESPDVHTLSAEYVIPEPKPIPTEPENPTDPENPETPAEAMMRTPSLDQDTPLISEPGRAIYSNGKGRLDLGYVDYFYGDFTIDLWICPMSSGTILANKTRDGYPKGWELSIENNRLKFDYAPRNIFPRPYWESAEFSIEQNPSISAPIDMCQWSHIAVVHERFGNVKLYINGKQVASAARQHPDHTLNNSMILSLFADGIERRALTGSVDELKIWDRALSVDELREEMHSTNLENKDGMVVYYNFNRGSLEGDMETFTCRPIKNRVSAEVTYPLMNVPVCARYVDVPGNGNLNFSTDIKDAQGNTVRTPIIKIGYPETDPAGAPEKAAAQTLSGNFGVYVFDAHQWQNEEDNLDTDFLDYHPLGYMIHSFEGNAFTDKTIEYTFYPVEGSFKADCDYRVYVDDIRNEKQIWDPKGTARYDAESGTIKLTGVTAKDIFDKKILIVTHLPAIEIEIEGVGADGVLNIYDDTRSVYPITARTLAGLEKPGNVYQIQSEGILHAGGLFFERDKVDTTRYTARGELRLDLTQLGAFNQSVRTILRSEDNPIVVDPENNITRPSMIPKIVEVRNRISPRTFGDALKLDRSYARIGDANSFLDLKGHKEFTAMGWVRIDDQAVLNISDMNLITLRDVNNVRTGIMLQNGTLRMLYNGDGCNSGDIVKLTSDDIGKWVHVAIAVSGGEIRFYKNGREYKHFNPYNPDDFSTSGMGPLFLGKNSGYGTTTADANDIFNGAFDQVGFWNRGLSKEEILKYMFSTPSLGDEGLLAYVNMDYEDSFGTRRELARDLEIRIFEGAEGSSEYRTATPLPSNPREGSYSTEAVSPIKITLPDGENVSTWVSAFRGTPYCYLNHDYGNYKAQSQEFYTVAYDRRQIASPSADATATLTYRNRGIIGDETLAVAFRRTGTLEHLAGFFPSSSVAPGQASFEVPQTYLLEPSELMFFTIDGDPLPDADARLLLNLGQTEASEYLVNSENGIHTIQLPDGVNEITVLSDVMVLPRYNDDPTKEAKLVVDRTEFASIMRDGTEEQTDVLDFSLPENRYKVKLDLDRIDKFAVNDLTVGADGAIADNLNIRFSLEPKVELRLLNGAMREVMDPDIKDKGHTDSAGEDIHLQNSFRTSEPIATLEVEAEFLQGCLPEGEQVQLEIISDLDHAVSIGNGSLLRNSSVTINSLTHHESPDGLAIHEGWNLIGNPYLSNINLTNRENVDYDDQKVTKFLYRCNPATGNYEVHDMTSFDANHQIHPFQPYFIQTMAEDATLTVTTEAKDKPTVNRKRSYVAVEKKQLVFELLSGDRVYDRAVILIDDNAADDFVTNEDAVKFWNVSGSSPEIYSITKDGHAVAVNATCMTRMASGNRKKVDLNVKSSVAGPMTMKLSASGIDLKTVHIRDNENLGTLWEPSAGGMTMDFVATANGTPADAPAKVKRRAGAATGSPRFTLLVDDITTDIDSPEKSGYTITTGPGTCVIAGLQGDADVLVYKPNGVNIVNTHTGEDSLEVSLEDGVYIVLINENGRQFTAKVVVGD